VTSFSLAIAVYFTVAVESHLTESALQHGVVAVESHFVESPLQHVAVESAISVAGFSATFFLVL